MYLQPVSSTENLDKLNRQSQSKKSNRNLQRLTELPVSGTLLGTYYVVNNFTFTNASSDTPNLAARAAFKKILDNYQAGVDEFEEEDIFSQKMTDWFEKYANTKDIILDFYKSSEINDSQMEHILSASGNANNYKTYSDRFDFLLTNLKSSSPKIRYGAAIGLLNLENVNAIPELTQAFDLEQIPVIKGTLNSVINQLQEIENS